MSITTRLRRLASWWSELWLWVIGIILGGLVFIVAAIAWDLAGRPVVGTEGLILQEQMLVAVLGAVLAFAIAMTTMQSSRIAVRHEAADRQKERRGIVLALVGSAIECATYAGWLAGLQQFGLKWRRRLLPETVAQREFTIEAWKLLAMSAAAVSRSLERVRYETPELVPIAEELFDAVTLALSKVAEGDIGGLRGAATLIRESADELQGSVPP